jgi:hypothetical protein
MESRAAGSCDAISEEILNAAEELRREVRSRSIRGILSVLRAKGFDVSNISPSTLNFHLNRRGATKEKHASEKGTFQMFQKDHANDLCQIDCSGGLYLPDPYNKGQHKQVHLISMIDDATRVVTHAAFYWDEQVPSLFDCFRKALLKTPEGRGKIERHIGTVKAGFYGEAKHSGLQTLDQLNEFFSAWLDKEYNNHEHKALGMTPLQRWQQDQEKGLVQLVTPEEIRHALMIEADRTVGKRTALIQLSNRLYQASRELAGKKVQVRWEADRRNPTIEIWLNGKLLEIAKEMVPGSNIDYAKRPQRQRQPEKTPKVLDSSKQYRLSLVSTYRQKSQPTMPGDYLSEPEFQQLVARVLDRELPPEELSYLTIAFAELSPLKDFSTESVLQKAAEAKGTKMHLRYYCDLLLQARLIERR